LILLANILMAIAGVLGVVLNFMLFLIIARVIVSWVNADPSNWIVRVIVSTTDPLLIPIRRKLPLAFGGLDFSPIVVMLLIYILQIVVVQSLNDYALQLKRPVYELTPTDLPAVVNE
jgi:YggT family protein